MAILILFFMISAYGASSYNDEIIDDGLGLVFDPGASTSLEVARTYDDDGANMPFSWLHQSSWVSEGCVWMEGHKIYQKPDSAQQKRTVCVDSCAIADYEGNVTVKHCEQQRELRINMELSRNAQDQLQTIISYKGPSSESVIGVFSCAPVLPDREENEQPGPGYVEFHLLDGVKTWQPMMPRADFQKRPNIHGVVSGDADHIDITQYLFCSSCADDIGHFFRMTAQYDNLHEVRITWGQERYLRRQLNGSAAEQIVHAQTINF